MTGRERAYYHREGRKLLLYGGAALPLARLFAAAGLFYLAWARLRSAYLTLLSEWVRSETVGLLCCDLLLLALGEMVQAMALRILCRCIGTHRPSHIPWKAVLLRAAITLSAFLCVCFCVTLGARTANRFIRCLLLMIGAVIAFAGYWYDLRLTPLLLLCSKVPSLTWGALCRTACVLSHRHLRETARLRFSFGVVLLSFLCLSLADGILRAISFFLLLFLLLRRDAATMLYFAALAAFPSQSMQADTFQRKVI